MLERKHVHRYTDVARIWVVTLCKEAGAEAAQLKAEQLGISKETRRHFFCQGKGHCSCSGEGLEAWIQKMERFHKREQGVAGTADRPSTPKLSEDDRLWLEALFLAKPPHERVYRKFAVEVQSAAAKSPTRKHLASISDVTVRRYCLHLKTAVFMPGTPLPPRIRDKRKSTYVKVRDRVRPPTETFKELAVEPPRPDSNVPF